MLHHSRSAYVGIVPAFLSLPVTTLAQAGNDRNPERIDHLLKAVNDTPAADEQQAQSLRALNTRMQNLRVKLNGDDTLSGRGEPAPWTPGRVPDWP